MLGAGRVTFWRKQGSGGGGGGPAGAPTNLQNTSSTTSSITLGWTNGDASADTEIYRDNVLINTATPGTSSYADTGRSANANHDYKIRHSKGGSFSSFLGPLTFYSLPNAPTSPSATADSDTQITLLWTDAHSLIVNVYRAGVYQNVVSAGVQTYVDTGLTAATNYSYTLRHQNPVWESADSASVNATTSSTDGPDAPPSGLTVTAVASATWTLNWTNGDATASTEVWKDGALVTTVGAGVSTYDASANASTAATFKVRHTKNSVTSAYSSEVTKTYPGVTAGSLGVTGTSATDEFAFAWTVVPGDAETGWDVLLTWNDDNAYPTDQVQGCGQDTDGVSVYVGGQYDVTSGGSVLDSINFTVAIRDASDQVMTSRSITGQLVAVEPNP